MKIQNIHMYQTKLLLLSSKRHSSSCSTQKWPRCQRIPYAPSPVTSGYGHKPVRVAWVDPSAAHCQDRCLARPSSRFTNGSPDPPPSTVCPKIRRVGLKCNLNLRSAPFKYSEGLQSHTSHVHVVHGLLLAAETVVR